MAKNQETEVYRLKKKKKNRCCSCIVTTLIVFVLIIGAAVGVGWYFGDQWTKVNLDMSLGEVFGTLGDLDKSSGEGVVTNAYTESDAQGLEQAIKDCLLIRQEEDMSMDALMQLWTDIDEGNYVPDYQENTGYQYIADSLSDYFGIDISEFMPSNPGSPVPDDQSTAMTFFLALLSKMDTARLLTVTPDDLVFRLSDKSLAALFNEVLKETGVIESLVSSLGISGVDDVLKLEQMILYKQQHETSGEISMLKATVSIKTREVADKFVGDALAQSGMTSLSGPVSWLANRFIPKKLYVTVDVGLVNDVGVKIQINNMDNDKMQRLFKLVNGVGSLDGASFDLNTLINEAYTENVGTLLTEIDQIIKFDENVSNGKVSVPVYDYILDATFNNVLDENQELPITVDELLEIIRDVMGNLPPIELPESAGLPESSKGEYYRILDGAVISRGKRQYV